MFGIHTISEITSINLIKNFFLFRITGLNRIALERSSGSHCESLALGLQNLTKNLMLVVLTKAKIN